MRSIKILFSRHIFYKTCNLFFTLHLLRYLQVQETKQVRNSRELFSQTLLYELRKSKIGAIYDFYETKISCTLGILPLIPFFPVLSWISYNLHHVKNSTNRIFGLFWVMWIIHFNLFSRPFILNWKITSWQKRHQFICQSRTIDEKTIG